MKKLWGGAFSTEIDEDAAEFSRSLESDMTFWREDVECSIAHARMLGQCGIITKSESAQLVKGLRQILKEGSAKLPQDVEDIHTSIEIRLGEIVGDTAGKLHTARSRNDQVATDTKLFLRKRVREIQKEIKSLQRVLLAVASKHASALMPGMTHQQHAQPVTLGFHLLAYFWAVQRHGWRMENIVAVTDGCPLGSAALAGTSFPIDRDATARALGFTHATPNALDGMSDRSYVLDALHACSALMLDLSRLSQELIVWSTPEFGWVSLPDSLTTGSSIMPQKRNPDMAELIRGRTGRAIGNYVSVATMMKGLMMGYNRDTQEDKPPLFDSLALTGRSLVLMRKMIKGAKWDVAKLECSTRGDSSTATDIADALVRHGVPFRKAHELVGSLSRTSREQGISLDVALKSASLPTEFKSLKGPFTPTLSAQGRESFGGSGRRAMEWQLKLAERVLNQPGFDVGAC